MLHTEHVRASGLVNTKIQTPQSVCSSSVGHSILEDVQSRAETRLGILFNQLLLL